MNKILLDEDYKEFLTGTYDILYHSSKNIQIKGDVTVNDLNKTNHDLSFTLNNNTTLNYNKVYFLTQDTSLTINLNNNNHLNTNILIINEKSNKFTININMLKNSSDASIKLRVINKTSNDTIDIICNGKVLASTKDNILLEDLKGLIINNDYIKISPNMFIDTNEVMANHLVTIGSFNKEDLFYLESKGLSYESACKMIIKSFILSNFNPEFKEKIMEVIN